MPLQMGKIRKNPWWPKWRHRRLTFYT